jgi:hypothetical protein
MFKRKGFETILASPPDYEKLVAEIYCDRLFVALVSQERGDGLFDIETPGPNLVENRIIRKVDAAGFSEAIEQACKRLQGEKA